MVATVVVASPTPQISDPIFPADSIFLHFDFTNWLIGGATLLSAVVKCTDLLGNDFTARQVSGAPTIQNATVVQQKITGAGTAIGDTYVFNCTGTFSDTQTETLSIKVPIGYTYGAVS